MEYALTLAAGVVVFVATYFLFKRLYPKSRWAMVYWWTSLGFTVCALVFLFVFQERP